MESAVTTSSMPLDDGYNEYETKQRKRKKTCGMEGV